MKTIKLILEIITLISPLIKYLYMKRQEKQKAIEHLNKPVHISQIIKQLQLWPNIEENLAKNSTKEIN